LYGNCLYFKKLTLSQIIIALGLWHCQTETKPSYHCQAAKASIATSFSIKAMASGEIKMALFLAQINQYEVDGIVREFSLEYVRKDGSWGKKARVAKAGIRKGQPVFTGARKPSTKFRYNLKETATIVLFDCIDQEYFTLRLYNITFYNGLNIRK
jgi:hypothetical protein